MLWASRAVGSCITCTSSTAGSTRLAQFGRPSRTYNFQNFSWTQLHWSLSDAASTTRKATRHTLKSKAFLIFKTLGTGDTLLPRSSHAPFVRCCTWIPSVGPSTPDTRSHLHLWAFPWSLVRQGETLNHSSLESRSWYGPHTSLIRFYDYRRSLKLMAINSPPASGLRTVVESSGVCQLRNGRPTLNYTTLHSIIYVLVEFLWALYARGTVGLMNCKTWPLSDFTSFFGKPSFQLVMQYLVGGKHSYTAWTNP